MSRRAYRCRSALTALVSLVVGAVIAALYTLFR